LDHAKKLILPQVSIYAAHFSWGFWGDVHKVTNSKPPFPYKHSDKEKELIESQHITYDYIVQRHQHEDPTREFSSRASNQSVNENLSNQELPVRPSCFVIGRHPVDRIISYYYQRVYGSYSSAFRYVPLSHLTIEEVESILITRHQEINKDHVNVIVDEGIRNATCRALANKKLTTG
jgi:hypothetical protein